MGEQPKGFTVHDRRHFAADGSPRDARDERDDKEHDERDEAKPPAETAPDPTADAGVDFASFLLSLAGQASYLLGLGSEPEKEAKVDLAGARHVISVLEMLRDKTEGRRTSEEDRLLEGILYELRMAWVSRSRAGVA